MNRVIGSFKDSIVLLKNNKSIFEDIFIMGLILFLFIPLTHILSINLTPLATRSLRIIFELRYILLPKIIDIIIAAGIIGIVKKSVEGDTSRGTFKFEIRKNYQKLFVGAVFFYILFYTNMAFWTFVIRPRYLRGISALRWFLDDIPFFAERVVLVDNLVIFYAYSFGYFGRIMTVFPIMYLFQFFAAGIVIEGYGILESFKESFNFVWNRKLSVLGYTILAMYLYSTSSRFLFFNYNAEFVTLFDKITFLLIALVSWTIITAVFWTYNTVYYIRAKKDDSTSS